MARARHAGRVLAVFVAVPTVSPLVNRPSRNSSKSWVWWPSRRHPTRPRPSPSQRQQLRERIRREAVKAASLNELRQQLEQQGAGGTADSEAMSEAFLEAIRTAYQPPWPLALQHCLDAVAPAPRSFARPSRGGADRDDLVLAGRKREGWALHIVLDTSGS